MSSMLKSTDQLSPSEARSRDSKKISAKQVHFTVSFVFYSSNDGNGYERNFKVHLALLLTILDEFQ